MESKKIKRKQKSKKRKIKATAIIDYSLLIVAVIATLLLMGTYLKRGIAGNLKEGADTFGHGRQHEGSFVKPGD